MALQSGLAAQIGYGTESTYGTAVTVDRFYPLVSESITQEIERLESAGIIAGRRVLDSNQWAAGNITISGSVEHELYDRQCGLLFRHMFGGVATSGAGPYTHTFTPGDLTNDHLTIQVGRPDVGGTVRPFTYAGCKITSWELACSVGEIATLGLEIVGKSETTATALATAAYSATALPVTFVHGAVTIGGSAVAVSEATLKGDNGYNTDRRFLNDQTIKEPLEAGLRTYDGELSAEFESLTQYNRFVNGTTAALVLTFTVGSNTLTVTTNVRFDGATPTVGGPDIVGQPIPFKCIGSTDAAAITAVYVTGDATP
jgi:hypothetical protein